LTKLILYVIITVYVTVLFHILQKGMEMIPEKAKEHLALARRWKRIREGNPPLSPEEQDEHLPTGVRPIGDIIDELEIIKK